MELNEKTYQFATKEAQLERANEFALTGYIIYYVIALITQWTACAMARQTVMMSVIITGVIIISCVLSYVTFKKKQHRNADTLYSIFYISDCSIFYRHRI